MLQEKVLSNITGKCYLTIDELPIYNWNKVYETTDLKWLLIDKSNEVKEKYLIELWIELQNQYLEEFGIETNFKQKLKLQKQRAIKTYEFIITNDRFLLTEIAIIDADLKALELKGNGITFWEIKSKLENEKGFRIDPKKITVIEWFYALKELSNGKTNKRARHN